MLGHERQAAIEVGPQRRAEALPQRAEGDLVDGADLVDDPADRVGEAAQGRRGCAGLRRRTRLGERGRQDYGFFGQAQAVVELLQPGHPVDDAVVGLGVDREPSAWHPVDHPAAEQRPVAVEHRLMQIGDQPQ